MLYPIDALKGLKSSQQPQRTKRKSSSFQNTLLSSTHSSTASQEPISLFSLTHLQSLIASYPEEFNGSPDASCAQSQSMLDHLDRLRDGFLTGRYTYTELAELKKSLDQATSLGEVGQEIRLRVAVELEKLRQFKPSA